MANLLFSLEDCDALSSNYRAQTLSHITQAGPETDDGTEAQIEVNLLHTFDCFTHHSYLMIVLSSSLQPPQPGAEEGMNVSVSNDQSLFLLEVCT